MLLDAGEGQQGLALRGRGRCAIGTVTSGSGGQFLGLRADCGRSRPSDPWQRSMQGKEPKAPPPPQKGCQNLLTRGYRRVLNTFLFGRGAVMVPLKCEMGFKGGTGQLDVSGLCPESSRGCPARASSMLGAGGC